MDIFLTVAAITTCIGAAAFCLIAMTQSAKSAALAEEYMTLADCRSQAAMQSASRTAGHCGEVARAANEIRKAGQQVRSEIGHAAELCEIVKLEVAKIDAIVDRLNAERAKYPPQIVVIHDEDAGEAVDVELVPEVPPAVPPTGSFTSAYKPPPGHFVTLPDGQPFSFAPTQVHPRPNSEEGK